jgi:hypothetical protein
MKIKYEYNNKFVSLKVDDNAEYTTNKIIGFFKNSLKKKLGISLHEYLFYKGFSVEKCRLCNIGYPPVKPTIEIINDEIYINGFEYIKKIYCYGSNIDCCGTQMNSNSFEFISKVNNISIDDAKIYVKKNNKSPFYIENWESEGEYRKSQSRSLEYYIGKYGITRGNERYKEHLNKISLSNSIESYINKYGVDGYKKFKEISKTKDSMSLNFFLEKNKGDYDKAIFEYENRKKSVDVSLKSFIVKYGEIEANERHKARTEKSRLTSMSNPNYSEICKSKGITIDKMVEKYGDEIGKEKYNSWRESISVPLCRSSKESLKIFTPLIEEIIKDNFINIDDIYIGDGCKNEFFIRENSKIFFYDFTIRSKKIIIEYNGTLFHPKNENSDWINPYNKETSKIAFMRQKNKVDIAKSNGFRVLEIWSDETGNLEKCINFIKEI